MSILNRPGLSRQEELEERFQRLAALWRDETGMLSSTTARAMHPAYQQIIGMGPEVLPFLLNALKKRPEPWFWALKAITGIDPISSEQRGRLQEMTAVWLRWGREQGYCE